MCYLLIDLYYTKNLYPVSGPGWTSGLILWYPFFIQAIGPNPIKPKGQVLGGNPDVLPENKGKDPGLAKDFEAPILSHGLHSLQSGCRGCPDPFPEN